MLRLTAHRARGAVGAAVLAGLAASALVACTPPGKFETKADIQPARPDAPVVLTVLDGSGDLSSGGKVIFENFKKAHPELVKDILYEEAGAPDVVGKIRAQALAGKVSISIVLGGADVLGSMQKENIATPLLPENQASLPKLAALQDPPRRGLQAIARGSGILNSFTPSGPLLEYQSTSVPDPPRTPATLLAWAKAHPGKFGYAQPNNSGPGRTFLMSLPYMLHDKDPQDPVNGWDKTWAYLKELGRYVSSYPSSTTILNKQLADGTLAIVTTQAAFDVGQHQNGTFAASIRPAMFTDQQWVSDGHFMIVPRGVSAQTLYVDMQFMSYLLTPAQQVQNFATGSITTAIKTVSPSMAAPAARRVIEKFGRPDFYTRAFKTGPIHAPLRPDRLQQAFDKWQREVGSRVGT
ncbi:MAG: extracellular solute-binding protein [Mycobacteriales bacterium]